MRRRSHIIVGPFVASALALASQAHAEPWEALVIGQTGPGPGSAFADAYHAGQALRDGGIAGLRRLRDSSAAEITAAVDAVQGAPRVLVYYSGALVDGGSAIPAPDGTVPLTALLGRLGAGGTQEVALLVEDCAGRDGPAGFVPPEPAPDQRLFLAASAGPNGTCPQAGDRLTDLLAAPGSNASLAQVTGVNWTEGDLFESLTLTRLSPAASGSPIAVDAPVVSVVSSDVVALSPVIEPVSAGSETVTAISAPAPQTASAAPTGGEVMIFAAPPQSQIAALPLAAGLPEPSIIVGLIEGQQATFDRATDGGEISASEIAYDNLAARQSLRQQDPDLFESLVAGGAFDPPGPLLARALQQELARMGCYRSGIDGIWGRGSRGSVQRYFDELDGVEPVSLEPEVSLFRQIIRKDDVACPAPRVVATPARSKPTASAPKRTTSTKRAAPTKRTAPKKTVKRAAPKPAAKPKIGSGMSLGVFR